MPPSEPAAAAPIGALSPHRLGTHRADPSERPIGAPAEARRSHRRRCTHRSRARRPRARRGALAAPTYASAMASGLAAGKGSYAAAGAAAGEPSPAAAAAQSPEALLSMLQSSTAGAEGVGVLGTSASAATGYVLRPQESAAWAQRLAPLVTNLQGVLSTVGPQKFCQMMDRVANPNDWSLVSEVSAGLQRGARLEVVQDSEIAAAIEASAVAVANTGAQVRLKTVAVDQSVVGAPGHNNTGSPVMVCRVDRTVDPTPGLTRVAAFALHLEPVSQLAAAEPPYLCLVFAWLGMRQAPSSAAAVVASGEGGSSAAAASAGGSGGGSSAAASAGGGGGVRRPGDWTCPGCGAHNFASRSVCFKCKNAKAGGSGGGGGFSGDVSQVVRTRGWSHGGQLPPRRLDLHRLPRAQLCLQVCVLQVQAAQVRR